MVFEPFGNFNCRQAGIIIDADHVDYIFTSVSGNVNICNRTLRISDVVIEGTPEPDTVATYLGVYVGVTTSLKSNEDQTGRKIPPEILFEILDKMSSEQ